MSSTFVTKRPHKKSRAGCKTCKSRKVKVESRWTELTEPYADSFPSVMRSGHHVRSVQRGNLTVFIHLHIHAQNMLPLQAVKG